MAHDSVLHDDPLLPVAPYLTGPHGADALVPAVQAAGGELLSASPRQVVYRPGRDLVVMFATSISWHGAAPVEETLIAGSSRRSPLPGTVTVQADDLQVQVWRYPFDPALPGLADAVTVERAAALLGVPTDGLELTVVSFRPCRRAVVRARRRDADDLYLKAVPPAEYDGLVARHRALHTAELNVPVITHLAPASSVVATLALPGRDLREAVVAGGRALPTAAQILAVTEQFSQVTIDGASPVVTLAAAAPRHAAMLRLVLPDSAPLLEHLLAAIVDDGPALPQRTIHGDLHDAQLRIDGEGRVVGVLDVDGAGPGDPLDDPARLTAHLFALSVLGSGHAPDGGDARRYAARLRADFRELVTDGAGFDRRVAAALIGLATGPYRSQTDGWQHATHEVLHLAERIAAHLPTDDFQDEKDLSVASSASHAGLVQ